MPRRGMNVHAAVRHAMGTAAVASSSNASSPPARNGTGNLDDRDDPEERDVEIAEALWVLQGKGQQRDSNTHGAPYAVVPSTEGGRYRRVVVVEYQQLAYVGQQSDSSLPRGQAASQSQPRQGSVDDGRASLGQQQQPVLQQRVLARHPDSDMYWPGIIERVYGRFLKLILPDDGQQRSNRNNSGGEGGDALTSEGARPLSSFSSIFELDAFLQKSSSTAHHQDGEKAAERSDGSGSTAADDDDFEILVDVLLSDEMTIERRRRPLLSSTTSSSSTSIKITAASLPDVLPIKNYSIVVHHQQQHPGTCSSPLSLHCKLVDNPVALSPISTAELLQHRIVPSRHVVLFAATDPVLYLHARNAAMTDAKQLWVKYVQPRLLSQLGPGSQSQEPPADVDKPVNVVVPRRRRLSDPKKPIVAPKVSGGAHDGVVAEQPRAGSLLGQLDGDDETLPTLGATIIPATGLQQSTRSLSAASSGRASPVIVIPPQQQEVEESKKKSSEPVVSTYAKSISQQEQDKQWLYNRHPKVTREVEGMMALPLLQGHDVMSPRSKGKQLPAKKGPMPASESGGAMLEPSPIALMASSTSRSVTPQRAARDSSTASASRVVAEEVLNSSSEDQQRANIVAGSQRSSLLPRSSVSPAGSAAEPLDTVDGKHQQPISRHPPAPSASTTAASTGTAQLELPRPMSAQQRQVDAPPHKTPTQRLSSSSSRDNVMVVSPTKKKREEGAAASSRPPVDEFKSRQYSPESKTATSARPAIDNSRSVATTATDISPRKKPKSAEGIPSLTSVIQTFDFPHRHDTKSRQGRRGDLSSSSPGEGSGARPDGGSSLVLMNTSSSGVAAEGGIRRVEDHADPISAHAARVPNPRSGSSVSSQQQQLLPNPIQKFQARVSSGGGSQGLRENDATPTSSAARTLAYSAKPMRDACVGTASPTKAHRHRRHDADDDDATYGGGALAATRSYPGPHENDDHLEIKWPRKGHHHQRSSRHRAAPPPPVPNPVYLNPISPIRREEDLAATTSGTDEASYSSTRSSSGGHRAAVGRSPTTNTQLYPRRMFTVAPTPHPMTTLQQQHRREKTLYDEGQVEKAKRYNDDGVGQEKEGEEEGSISMKSSTLKHIDSTGSNSKAQSFSTQTKRRKGGPSSTFLAQNSADASTSSMLHVDANNSNLSRELALDYRRHRQDAAALEASESAVKRQRSNISDSRGPLPTSHHSHRHQQHVTAAPSSGGNKGIIAFTKRGEGESIGGAGGNRKEIVPMDRFRVQSY